MRQERGRRREGVRPHRKLLRLCPATGQGEGRIEPWEKKVSASCRLSSSFSGLQDMSCDDHVIRQTHLRPFVLRRFVGSVSISAGF